MGCERKGKMEFWSGPTFNFGFGKNSWIHGKHFCSRSGTYFEFLFLFPPHTSPQSVILVENFFSVILFFPTSRLSRWGLSFDPLSSSGRLLVFEIYGFTTLCFHYAKEIFLSWLKHGFQPFSNPRLGFRKILSDALTIAEHLLKCLLTKITPTLNHAGGLLGGNRPNLG